MNPLSGFLFAIPEILYFFFLIAGIVVGAIKMDLYPKPAKWVMSGFGLMLIAKVVVLIGGMAAEQSNYLEDNPIIGAVNTMSVILNVMGLAMLIVAAFSDRTRSNSLGCKVTNPKSHCFQKSRMDILVRHGRKN
ncbi:MAG: hypothetical protein AB8B55_01350 [Mariniblastus sp.]